MSIPVYTGYGVDAVKSMAPIHPRRPLPVSTQNSRSAWMDSEWVGSVTLCPIHTARQSRQDSAFCVVTGGVN